MPPVSAITTSRKRVFDSVFATSPGGGGGFTSPGVVDPLAATRKPDKDGHAIDEDGPGVDIAAWDRAWNAATAFLAIPDRGLAALSAFEDIGEEEFLRWCNRFNAPDKKTADALRYLVSRRDNAGERSIINWYGREIRRHFLKNFRDGLFNVCFTDYGSMVWY